MKTCFNARFVLSCKKMKTCFRSNFYLVALTLHKKWKHTSTPQKIEIVALFEAKYTKSMKKKWGKRSGDFTFFFFFKWKNRKMEEVIEELNYDKVVCFWLPLCMVIKIASQNVGSIAFTILTPLAVLVHGWNRN
jgi:hypothetical protein